MLWSASILGWIKCNIDGVIVGNMRSSACGDIFLDHSANHILSFSAFLGCEPPETVELIVAIMALEMAKKKKILNFDLKLIVVML